MGFCDTEKRLITKKQMRRSGRDFLKCLPLLALLSCAPEPQQPNVCSPPVDTSEISISVNTILNYESMQHLSSRYELGRCNVERRMMVTRLVENYNKCDSLEETDRKFQTIFDQENVPQNDRPTLTNLTNAIYVEINHLVPWSLRDYTTSELEFLIPTKRTSNRQYQQGIVPHYHIENSEDYEAYRILPVALELRRTDQRSTANTVLEWIPINFFHPPQGATNSNCSAQDYNEQDYSTENTTSSQQCNPHTNFLKIEALFRERNLIMGCHTAASLGAAVLRALNIPAAELDFGIIDSSHGALYLPSLNLYSHGDWLAYDTGMSGQYMLYTREELPRVIAGMWSGCICPQGIEDAQYHVGLFRREDTRNLYIEGMLSLNQGDIFPIGFVDRDISHPVPQVVSMMQRLSQYRPRIIPRPGDNETALVVGDDQRIENLNEARERVCRN